MLPANLTTGRAAAPAAAARFSDHLLASQPQDRRARFERLEEYRRPARLQHLHGFGNEFARLGQVMENGRTEHEVGNTRNDIGLMRVHRDRNAPVGQTAGFEQAMQD